MPNCKNKRFFIISSTYTNITIRPAFNPQKVKCLIELYSFCDHESATQLFLFIYASALPIYIIPIAISIVYLLVLVTNEWKLILKDKYNRKYIYIFFNDHLFLMEIRMCDRPPLQAFL